MLQHAAGRLAVRAGAQLPARSRVMRIEATGNQSVEVEQVLDAHEQAVACDSEHSVSAAKRMSVDESVFARLSYRDGSSYEGHVLDGARHGQGVLCDAYGNSYRGRWREDRKDGFFEVTYENGERFHGMFVNDRRNGNGRHFYSDGSRYEGEYCDDVRHGRGVYTVQHEYFELQKVFARVYEHGTLRDERELMQGLLKLTDRPGHGFGAHVDEETNIRYEGDHADYKPHGKGMLAFPNGDQFIGDFRAGKRHGIGMHKSTDGQFVFQEWCDGTLVKESPSDYLNWKNLFWYDEGGFASHN